ncbi:purine-nucleoside phosphorylase [Pararhizobium haloflavum]|uniref:purine-nucleoside phosphorylase n=1 Tax=Pararhizobium haloflavum TaxID=2037914 RepID=UPI000C174DB1|nr:purine-nucleoside phosphorylase [Pararhizobium haloflavum]
MKYAAEILNEKLDGLKPETAIVLGSGLGGLVDSLEDAVSVPYQTIAGFPGSGVSGHAGKLVGGRLAGRPIVMLAGRVHYYEKGEAAAMRPVLETVQALGVANLILTNAAGSVREDMPPGSVMRITDHINYSGMNPLIGEESDAGFVGMTSAYDAALGKKMNEAAGRAGVELHEGVYMWFSGPSFETPAEIRMARTLGADAVGMSTVPEVIMARFLGLKVAAASVITNLGAGMTGSELSHQETKDMAPIGGERLARVLTDMMRNGDA